MVPGAGLCVVIHLNVQYAGYVIIYNHTKNDMTGYGKNTIRSLYSHAAASVDVPAACNDEAYQQAKTTVWTDFSDVLKHLANQFV